MRSLKAIVIVMGVFIVIGMGILAWGIAVKLGDKVGRDTGAPEVAAWAAPVEVDIPPGAVVVEARAEDDRLIVNLRYADGDAAILVFDLETGQRIGSIRLNQSAGGR